MPTTPVARHDALGRVDVHVAGPDDDVDGGDRLGAVGHRGDRLRAADAVDLLDAGEERGGERHRGDRAVGPGRDAQHPLRDPGHGRRDRGHQDGRRVGGASARDVEPGAVDGPDRLGDGDTVGVERRGRRDGLGLVVRPDPGAGHLEGIADLGGRRGDARPPARRR